VLCKISLDILHSLFRDKSVRRLRVNCRPDESLGGMIENVKEKFNIIYYMLSQYNFNNTGRIGCDTVDNTMQNLSNSKYANYILSNFSENKLSHSYVNFATEQPDVMFSGIAHGSGLNGDVIDYDSKLLINSDNERPLEKLQLNQRPFSTVPYLGKGSCDPSIESMLLQGELANDKKSVSTIMDKSFLNYSMYPVDSKMQEHVSNPKYTVEEAALNGWVRGGSSSREVSY